ncbi:two-component system, NarL family, response regulator [Fistulifera solaris]|uniref:Two-component system, NarL family, response regulator n=1 Tax=Fistulifera solaris TaxID=1519565 RepID=A0A1Z5J7W5_FISSO|nr:two-component system, NarL family, response regulator [Fistulifera solaris]|eukprot:GAX09871.1 two-component system, NarL family, response regulator [Fistulifera solaris]
MVPSIISMNRLCCITFFLSVSDSFLPLLKTQTKTPSFSLQASSAKEAWRSTKWLLLVDDEASIRQAVGRLLHEKGYQVTACASGEAALQVVVDEPQVPDVIVSDVRMPGGMDGLEFLQKIRQNERLVAVPVVLLTAKGQTRDRIAGYEAACDAYLTKPFDPDELVSLVDAVLQRQEDTAGNVSLEELQKDLQEIKQLLLEHGGGGVGNGWVQATQVFLAPDERQVLEYLCQGLKNKEIAERVFLSTRRVEQLMTSMFRKTQTKNRTELVRWAVSTGTVQLS